jgi:hypothetical protein
VTTVSPLSFTSSARRCFHMLALGLAISCTSRVSTETTAAPTMSSPQVAAAPAQPQQELQFADEITRRLRRIGLNFNRARLQRPYDPAGELC